MPIKSPNHKHISYLIGTIKGLLDEGVSGQSLLEGPGKDEISRDELFVREFGQVIWNSNLGGNFPGVELNLHLKWSDFWGDEFVLLTKGAGSLFQACKGKAGGKFLSKSNMVSSDSAEYDSKLLTSSVPSSFEIMLRFSESYGDNSDPVAYIPPVKYFERALEVLLDEQPSIGELLSLEDDDTGFAVDRLFTHFSLTPTKHQSQNVRQGLGTFGEFGFFDLDFFTSKEFELAKIKGLSEVRRIRKSEERGYNFSVSEAQKLRFVQ